MSKGSGTRSGLLWEVERILQEIVNNNLELPQILFMENVTQVHNDKNINDFMEWISFLEKLGYKNYWQDLNAKDYGIPQSRNRTFMFSFLGNYNYKFPPKIELKTVMKDYLEDEVEEKYYINNEKSTKLIETLIDNGTLPNTIPTDSVCVDASICCPRRREVANCITARYDSGISNKQGYGVGGIEWKKK